ncbi:MAG: DUF1648 domain-containing protein [Gemmatimonadaceae bacterium]|nr:DUF1648 domain-containing protein [Gemmatimonadaceae bacterium]
MRPIRLAAWGLCLATVAIAAAAWPDLPDPIPTHLGPDGQPDGWSARSLSAWFLMPALAIALQGLMVVVGRVALANPQHINIPDKERLLALPPRFRAPVLATVAGFLDLVALGVAVLLAALQWQFTEVALGRHGVPPVVLFLAPGLLVIVLAFGIARMTGAVDSAHRAWKEAGAPPS